MLYRYGGAALCIEVLLCRWPEVRQWLHDRPQGAAVASGAAAAGAGQPRYPLTKSRYWLSAITWLASLQGQGRQEGREGRWVGGCTCCRPQASGPLTRGAHALVACDFLQCR